MEEIVTLNGEIRNLKDQIVQEISEISGEGEGEERENSKKTPAHENCNQGQKKSWQLKESLLKKKLNDNMAEVI